MTSSYAAVAVHGSPWCRSRDALHSGQRATSRHGSGEWAEPEEPWPSSPADSTSVPQIGQAFGRSESPTLRMPVGNFQPLTFPSSSGIRLLMHGIVARRAPSCHHGVRLRPGDDDDVSATAD